MKSLLIAALAVTVGLTTLVSDAEAKRLGGGKSVGMNRSADTMKAPAAPPAKQATAAPAAAPAAAAAAAPKSGMSRWLGPLAGLAAGIGLAALFSHLGMGEAMGNFVMIALLVVAAVVVFKLLFRKKQPEAEASGMQYAGAGAAGMNAPAQFEAPASAGVGAGIDVASGQAAATTGNTARSIPADFDVEGFVRQAKLNYIRLQAANDRGDMDDIKQFTSPEMFAEIQMEYQERGKAVQETDVMTLNAELLDVTEETTQYIASVRFFGQIREAVNAAPEAFDELWHLTKPRDGSRGWAVAGIQQFQ